MAARSITIAAIAAVVAVTCVALGFWQLRRLDDRRESNERIAEALRQSPVTIAAASGSPEPGVYRPVRATGRYDTRREVLLYGRSLDGEPGHHVVTPLVLGDGSAVLVLRGWVPFRLQEAPVPTAAPPAADVAVTGFLLPDEGDGSDVPDARGTIGVLDVRGIASTLPYDVHPLAIQLARQEPPPGDLPRPLRRPVLSEGPHRSYAIQWFLFATVAAIGGAVLIRRDRRGAAVAPDHV